ncbi:hypothetical protein BDV32DRAFT_122851 [Aspergillus pseudonomiae]|nr:hypothetical protein BDV32DRAFT_122851 [Aspergillus pseudonomiae]
MSYGRCWKISAQGKVHESVLLYERYGALVGSVWCFSGYVPYCRITIYRVRYQHETRQKKKAK